jgi:hypothetical protein
MPDVEAKKVLLADLIPMDANARTISDSAMSGLEASMDRFGYVEPIVVNCNTMRIIGGHKRCSILIANGVREATVMMADLPREDEQVANITLNNPKIEGIWDDSVFSLLRDVQHDNLELFEELRLNTLQESLEKQMDRPPEGIDSALTLDDAVIASGELPEPEREFDTECPCCRHKWNIRAEDVAVDGGFGA